MADDVVQRFDTIELRLDKAEPLENGWLRAPASIGSVGVFEYLRADGTITREYRPPEEVFHPDSLRSFELVPVTNDHPPMRLDSRNTRIFHVGNGGIPKADAKKQHVVSDIMLTDAAAIADARAGKRQISPGYTVKLDHTPGTTPDGKRYDAVQRQIRGNHIALVDRGRQGPEVSLRMDSGDAVAITTDPEKRDSHMAKINIDGKRYEVADEVAAAFKAMKGKAGKKPGKPEAKADEADDEDVEHEDADDAEEGDRDDAKPNPPKPAAKPRAKPSKATGEGAMQARIDALEEARKEDAARVDARVDLLVSARRICGDDYRADGKSDLEVMTDVVLKADPGAKEKLEARKDDAGYVAARYEIALEKAAEGRNAGQRLLDAARSAGTRKDADDEVSKAKAKFETDTANAWKGAEAKK